MIGGVSFSRVMLTGTERLTDRVPEHATFIARLYLANAAQIYPEDRGMNYSVRLGRRAARLLAAVN